MSDSPSSRKENRLLLLITYVMLASIAVLAYRSLTQAGLPWEIHIVLLAVFGIILFRMPSHESPPLHAHLYLIVQASIVTVLMVISPDPSLYPTLLIVLSAQAIALFPSLAGWLWITGLSLTTAIVFIAISGFQYGLAPLPIYTGANFFFGIVMYALAQANQARRKSQQLLDELQQTHLRLQEYATRVEELAVAEERNRLAREMHDAIGHHLTVSAVQLEGAQRLIEKDPERAAKMVTVVRSQIKEALDELRQTVAALREPLEAGLELTSALKRLAVGFEQAAGIKVNRILPESNPPLPETHRLALYRAAQEGLTNIGRHANAREAWLQFSTTAGAAVLLVSDNGVGLQDEIDSTQGFGLRGLRERAVQLGGELYVEPRPGGGTRLTFRLPVPTENSNA
ncbi:MAG: sensor histidine kinase [Anaerolineales bacterium]|nr:sensor histidine kinase [Anaerolineales bacterium]